MIIEEKRPLKDGLPPVHPGELLAEYVAGLGIAAVTLGCEHCP